MKNFIDSIIKLLINTVIIIVLVVLCIVLYVFLISKMNNATVEDTISYFKSSDNQVAVLSSDTKKPINIYLNSSDSINNNETINNNKNNFYYEQLDDNAKIIYNELNDNINNLKKSNYKIDFSTKFNTLLNQSDGQYKLNFAFQSALDAFFYDHPELFYIDLTKISLIIKYNTIGSRTTYTVSLAPKDGEDYWYDNFQSEKQIDEAISSVENIKNSTIKSLDSKSDYEKALYVHDALVNSLEYDSSTIKPNSHNIYGALVEKSVVCEGYAKAFKYILDDLNIECILVNGTVTNSTGKTESHMWNYIKLDGNWYGVDVTWDDPVIVGGYSKNITRHDYFCKGSNVFNQTHIVSDKISDEGKSFKIPTLSSKDYK